ncbi:hypothetical protein H311_04747, partial [Anncaliia algerae PRA109]
LCLGSEKEETSNFLKDNHPNMPKKDRKISESERILQIFSSLKKEFVKERVLNLQFYVTNKENYTLNQNDDIPYEEKHILFPDIISVENVEQVGNFLSINIDKIQSIANDLYDKPDIKKLLEDLKYSSQLFEDFYEEYTKLRENKYSSEKNKDLRGLYSTTDRKFNEFKNVLIEIKTKNDKNIRMYKFYYLKFLNKNEDVFYEHQLKTVNCFVEGLCCDLKSKLNIRGIEH